MSPYSERIVANVDFFGERARELADQEVERSRALDTKAGAIIAASVALIGAAAVSASKLAELSGGTSARTLWASEIGFSVVALLLAAGLAVWALSPKVFRTTVSFSEIEQWPTAVTLELDPTFNAGKLLRASIHSVGHSRNANKRKADRLTRAFIAFAAALTAIVALVVSVAVHAAAYDHGSSRPRSGPIAGHRANRCRTECVPRGRRTDVPHARSRS